MVFVLFFYSICSSTRRKCPKLGIFANPAGDSEGFGEKENPNGRGVNDYVVTRAWGAG